LLAIIGLVLFWYGLVPVAGALIKRHAWFKFRSRFNRFRLYPIMDSQAYWRQESGGGETRGENTRIFRFTGDFESASESHTLWVRGGDLLVPVCLKSAETYILPMQGGEGIPEPPDPGADAPEKIRWEKFSALAEGAKVFVAGELACREGRWLFASTKETPLMVIFYDGPDHSLAAKAVWAGRQRGEYFNRITPYALILGTLCLLFVAGHYLTRPAFRPMVIFSIAAMFVPLVPLMPPGLLFTVVYRRLAWRSRILRAYSDLAKLPLCYFAQENGKKPLPEMRVLPNGEPYGFARSAELLPEMREGKIPWLIPEITERRGGGWHIFGAVSPGDPLPRRPKDPLATFGILPGEPRKLAKRCAAKAYALETAAWLALFAGIALNVLFLGAIASVLI